MFGTGPTLHLSNSSKETQACVTNVARQSAVDHCTPRCPPRQLQFLTLVSVTQRSVLYGCRLTQYVISGQGVPRSAPLATQQILHVLLLEHCLSLEKLTRDALHQLLLTGFDLLADVCRLLGGRFVPRLERSALRPTVSRLK